MERKTISDERMTTILGLLYFGTNVEVIDQRTGGAAWDRNASFFQTIRIVQNNVSNVLVITEEEAYALIYFEIVELDGGTGDEFSDEERKTYLLSGDARSKMDKIIQERKLPKLQNFKVG